MALSLPQNPEEIYSLNQANLRHGIVEFFNVPGLICQGKPKQKLIYSNILIPLFSVCARLFIILLFLFYMLCPPIPKYALTQLNSGLYCFCTISWNYLGLFCCHTSVSFFLWNNTASKHISVKLFLHSMPTSVFPPLYSFHQHSGWKQSHAPLSLSSIRWCCISRQKTFLPPRPGSWWSGIVAWNNIQPATI